MHLWSWIRDNLRSIHKYAHIQLFTFLREIRKYLLDIMVETIKSGLKLITEGNKDSETGYIC